MKESSEHLTSMEVVKRHQSQQIYWHRASREVISDGEYSLANKFIMGGYRHEIIGASYEHWVEIGIEVDQSVQCDHTALFGRMLICRLP